MEIHALSVSLRYLVVVYPHAREYVIGYSSARLHRVMAPVNHTIYGLVLPRYVFGLLPHPEQQTLASEDAIL